MKEHRDFCGLSDLISTQPAVDNTYTVYTLAPPFYGEDGDSASGPRCVTGVSS